MIHTLEPILATHPFLKGLEPSLLWHLVGCASNVRFNSGQLIFHEGEDANEFYIIREGSVALETAIPERGTMTVDTLHAGEVLGWSWLISPYQWHFDARALEDTVAIALDGKCLRKKCDDDHYLGYELMKRFAHIIEHRLQKTRMKLLNVYEPLA